MILMAALVLHNKILALILVKKIQICLSLHYNHDNSYLLVSGKEIFEFKVDNKNKK